MLEQFNHLLTNPVFWMAVILLLAGLAILAFALLVWLRKKAIKEGAHPVIVSFLDKAIAVAFKASETAFDRLNERLHGVQKLELAGKTYDLLPDVISIKILGLNLSINWKKEISKDEFVKYIDQRYQYLMDEFEEFQEDVLEEYMKDLL